MSVPESGGPDGRKGEPNAQTPLEEGEIPESTEAAGGDLHEFIGGDEPWPEATIVPAKVTESGASGADSWPQAAEVPQAGYAPAAPTRASGASSSLGVDKAAPGLRRFIAELSTQLAEEVKRREVEEEELERRAAEKKRLLEELDMVKKQKEKLEIEQRADEAAAAEIEQQHSKLAEEHRALRQEVAKQEEELEQLRAEAKARTGQGRDWARDGPEKDALVETKLRIAEAHEDLAQLRQQLWLNREGLKRQLAELQAENMRLRTGRSPLA